MGPSGFGSYLDETGSVAPSLAGVVWIAAEPESARELTTSVLGSLCSVPRQQFPWAVEMETGAANREPWPSFEMGSNWQDSSFMRDMDPFFVERRPPRVLTFFLLFSILLF